MTAKRSVHSGSNYQANQSFNDGSQIKVNDSIEDHGVQAPEIDIKQGLTDLSSSKIAKVDDFAEYADAEAENGAVKDISPSIRNDEELV